MMNHLKKLSLVLATGALALGGSLAGATAHAEPTGAGAKSAAQASDTRAVMRPQADAHFYPTSTIHRNEAWTSGNGRAVLRVQEDGNFVLYKDNRAAWQAPGAWPNGDHAVMQQDGNFVLYDRNNRALWASNTQNRGAYVAVQDDGNVVVYNGNNQPLWATNTGD
ncbi:hypothetical protein ACIGZJ_00435 [Kitasatospora sp. NPDC052868]|uniref:hypothetical protein n=1 Tax=Kitasatospora sp. NPDC052868 TaxID=3364060 RepID=UPI0037CC6C7D